LKTFGLLLALFAAVSTYAEPVVTTSFEYYDIKPAQRSDINNEMSDKSPIRQGSSTFLGLTKWHVKWRFNYKMSTAGLCSITKVSTTLDVKYTMPRIAEDFAVKADVLTAFNRYYEALMLHEEEHKNSGLYAAREIEAALPKLETDTDCDRLVNTANSLGHKIIKKYYKRDADYDKKTDHGRLEGVDINNYI